MRFSERHGFKPIRESLQIESTDAALRNGLWDLVYGYLHLQENEQVRSLFLISLWINYLKRPRDEIYDTATVMGSIRQEVLRGQWYEIFDLIEYFSDNFPFQDKNRKPSFISTCNGVLEREMSAYRLVGTQITRLTDEQEIAAIETAQLAADDFKPVAVHVNTALARMSDRENPDFRNSIKESISAVESACRIVTGSPKATLGDALKLLEKRGVTVHPALNKAFGNLYGYASDESGIRHSLLGQSTVDFEDAKFMLVACSAFVNLLRARATPKN